MKRLPILCSLLLVPMIFAGCAGLRSTPPDVTPGNTAVIPATRATPTNWLARHEGFVAEANKGGVDLLFIGDSITDGWRNRGREVWDRYYAPRRAANFGIGGDRTQHVLWRIQNGELQGIKPKVVVLMIGTNNSNTNSAPEISEGVELIVHELRTRLRRSKVLLLAVFPRNRPTDRPNQSEIINQVNERIAKLHNGRSVFYLNINDRFVGPDGKVPADIMPDFLHPHEKGYQIWAEAMEPTLAQLMK